MSKRGGRGGEVVCKGCGTVFTAKQAPASGKCGPCNLKEMGL